VRGRDEGDRSRPLRELDVLIGAFVTLASIPMTIVLLTAVLTVHLHYGFNSITLLAVTSAGARLVRWDTKWIYYISLA
jgi:putative oxidoreductase